MKKIEFWHNGSHYMRLCHSEIEGKSSYFRNGYSITEPEYAEAAKRYHNEFGLLTNRYGFKTACRLMENHKNLLCYD